MSDTTSSCSCTCYPYSKTGGPAYCTCPCSDTEKSYTEKALDKAKAEKEVIDKITKEYEEGVKEIKDLSSKITDKEIDYIKTIYDAYPDGIPKDILATLEARHGERIISKIIDVFSTTTLVASKAPISSFTATSGKTYTTSRVSIDPIAPSTSRDLENPDDEYAVWWVECFESAVPGGYPLTSEGGDGCCGALTMNFGSDYSAYSQWFNTYFYNSGVFVYNTWNPQGPSWTGIDMQTAIANCAANCCSSIHLQDDCEDLQITLAFAQNETVDLNGVGQQDAIISVNIVWPSYPNAIIDIQLQDFLTGTVLETVPNVQLPANNLQFTGLAQGTYEITPPLNFSIADPNTGGIIEIWNCNQMLQYTIVKDDIVLGCMDPNACNYNPEANLDDGSCLYDDCEGICGGDAYLDNCDDCVGGTTGVIACEQDCAGVWGGTFQTDECGECEDPLGELWNQSCTDCAGIVNGPNLTDICGNCNDPNNPSLWNRECTGCLDKCAINYDPNAIQGCEDCCLHIDFKVNCTCCESTNTPSITIYWFHPQGADGTLTGGTITYGDTVVTIPDSSVYTAHQQTSDGQYYSYLTVDLGAAGSEVTSGIYTLQYDNLTAVDGGGAPLTPTAGIQVKKCHMVLCDIESNLQKYMKDIILANKCCDCDKLKETYYKAWTLYRALKITPTCGIDAYVDDTIKQIDALIKEMKNGICNKC